MENSLLAGNWIELLAAQEEDYSFYESSRRGGLFSSSRYQRDEVHDVRAVGTDIDAGGDLLIASGGDQIYQGARLTTGNDLALLSEGAIHFDTASDIRSEAHERSRGNFAWQSAHGDIDWRQVEAIHDSWNYSQSGLGPGAALAVSIVAAAWAGPTAAGLVNNAIGAAMVGAGAGSLAGTGAVGLINQRGDLGAALGDTLSSDSLRGAALAALSAGATQGMTDHVWGTQTNTTTGATTNLSLGEWGDIGRFAGQRATQAAIDAGIRAAIDGGSFEAHLGDSVENAVAHVVSGVLFNAVGDLANDHLWQEGDPQKIALHALIGGSISEAMGGDFATGALAAGASEALVHQLVGDASRTEFSNAAAQIVGIVAAELAGGDVNDGAFIAGQVESYNRQLHTAERELARELAEGSDGDYTLEQIEDALRGMYHDGLGEGRGDNTIIDLQDDLAAIDAAYYDYGGEWLARPGEDGTTRYLVQTVPTDTPPELIAYIIEQTGGDDSPYRTAVYRLPAEEAAPGQPRDRLTGRPLNEDGHSCADAACIAQGANIDYSDPAAQAWNRALNAEAIEKVGTLAEYGLVASPIGVGGKIMTSLALGSSLSGAYENNELTSEAIGGAMSKLHEIALKEVFGGVGGVRVNAVLSALGYYDEMNRDILGDKEILQFLGVGEQVGE